MYPIVWVGPTEIMGDSDLIEGPDGLRPSARRVIDGTYMPLVYLYTGRIALWSGHMDAFQLNQEAGGMMCYR